MTDRFARVPIAAAHMQGLGEHALRVLIALCAHAGRAGKCWPSLSTIAKHCGLDRRQVPRAIAKLVSVGLVTKLKVAAGRSVTYQVHYQLTSPKMSVDVAGDSSVDDHATSPEMSPAPTTDISRDALTAQDSEQPKEQPIEGLFEAQEVCDDLAIAVAVWNTLADELGLPRISRLTDGRKSKLRARLKEAAGLAGWRSAIEKIRNIPWMLGGNGWRVHFDYVLRPDNFTKLMEGAYDHPFKRAGSVDGSGFAALFAEERRRRTD